MYFIEYVLSGGVYILYCIFLIICALACLGVINRMEEHRQYLIMKKVKELKAEKEKNRENNNDNIELEFNKPENATVNGNNKVVQPILFQEGNNNMVVNEYNNNNNNLNFNSSNFENNLNSTENKKDNSLDTVEKTSDGFIVFGE